MTFAPTFTITNRMTQAITCVGRVRGFHDEAGPAAEWGLRTERCDTPLHRG